MGSRSGVRGGAWCCVAALLLSCSDDAATPSPDGGDETGGGSTGGGGGTPVYGKGGTAGAGTGGTAGAATGGTAGHSTGGASGRGGGSGEAGVDSGSPDDADGGGEDVDAGTRTPDASSDAADIADSGASDAGGSLSDGGRDADACPSSPCLGPATYAIPLQIKFCTENPTTCGGPPLCSTDPGGTLKASFHEDASGGHITLDSSSVDSRGLFGFHDNVDIPVATQLDHIEWGSNWTCVAFPPGSNYEGSFGIGADCKTGKIDFYGSCSEDVTFNNCPGPSDSTEVIAHTTFVPAQRATCSR